MSAASRTKLPILCRIGKHNHIPDGCMLSVSMACSRCGDQLDETAGRIVAFERQLWNEAPDGTTVEQLAWVKPRYEAFLEGLAAADSIYG